MATGFGLPKFWTRWYVWGVFPLRFHSCIAIRFIHHLQVRSKLGFESALRVLQQDLRKKKLLRYISGLLKMLSMRPSYTCLETLGSGASTYFLLRLPDRETSKAVKDISLSWWSQSASFSSTSLLREDFRKLAGVAVQPTQFLPSFLPFLLWLLP